MSSECQVNKLDEEALKDAVIDFDSKIFTSIWRQLKPAEANEQINDNNNSDIFAPLPAEFNTKIDDFKRDSPPLFLNADGTQKPTIEFARPNCVLITTDKKSIGANRELLASESLLLKLEFLGEDPPKFVKLPHHFDALVPVVTALYHHEENNPEATCQLLSQFELPLLFEIFDTATRLNIPFLIDTIGTHLFKNATPSTYVLIYHKLEVFCERLAKQLWAKINADFHKVIISRTHKLLTFPELRRALFNDRINITRGQEVSIMRSWARYNHVENMPDEFQTMGRQLTEQQGALGRFRNQRLPYSVLFALGGWGAHGPTKKLEILNGYTEQWNEPRSSIGELPSPRCYYAAISMPESQSVYVLGGFNGQQYYEGSTRFSLETLTWDDTSYAPLHERRCYVNAARMDSTHILACGGHNNTTRMNTAEVLDTERNVWSTIAPMNVVRSDAHAVELDGRMYIVGGFDGHACHRSVEFYDPHHNQWLTLQRNMHEKRSGVSALAINGALFAVGGFTGRHRLSTAEFWDPREGYWHSVSSMHLSRSNFGIAELRSNPVCVGGYDGHGTTKLCERFDWRADKWQNLPPLRYRRSALSLFRVDNLSNIERLINT